MIYTNSIRQNKQIINELLIEDDFELRINVSYNNTCLLKMGDDVDFSIDSLICYNVLR